MSTSLNIFIILSYQNMFVMFIIHLVNYLTTYLWFSGTVNMNTQFQILYKWIYSKIHVSWVVHFDDIQDIIYITHSNHIDTYFSYNWSYLFISSTLYIYVIFCPYLCINQYIDHQLGNIMFTFVRFI